jgi:hypothetical protein
MNFGRWIRASLVVLSLAVPASAQSLVTITPGVVYGHRDGMAITFDVFTPPRPNGAAVLHMGAGWTVNPVSGNS